MPASYHFEAEGGLVVFTVSGEPPPLELRFWVDRAAADPDLPAVAPVLVRGDGNDRPPPVWDIPELAGLVDRLLARFGRRLGVVSRTPGMAAALNLLATLTTAGRVRAFAGEPEARAWLLPEHGPHRPPAG